MFYNLPLQIEGTLWYKIVPLTPPNHNVHSFPKRTSHWHWQPSALLELNHCWTKSELTNPITAIIWGSTSGKATLSLIRMTTISRIDKMKDFKWRESLCCSLTLDKFWYFLSLVHFASPSVITDILTTTPPYFDEFLAADWAESKKPQIQS